MIRWLITASRVPCERVCVASLTVSRWSRLTLSRVCQTEIDTMRGGRVLALARSACPSTLWATVGLRAVDALKDIARRIRSKATIKTQLSLEFTARLNN